MASSIQLLRSTNTQERPFPGNLLEGQPAVNLNASEPGLFFKAADGSLVKFGPVAITSDGSPPNSSPQGSSGNTVGELWLDKSVDPAVLKVYDGAAWVDAGSGGGGGGEEPGVVTLQRWIKIVPGGETTLTGTDDTGQILSYTPGLEELFLNGVLLTRGVDYIATTGSSISLSSPLANADEVTVLGWSPFNILGEIDGSIIVNGSISGSKIEDEAVTDIKVSPTAEIQASKLAFLQSGATSARDLQSKLTDFVSVKDFGAVGDGVTDDTAAIQAAIDYALTLASGDWYIPDRTVRILFPAAFYAIDGNLIVPYPPRVISMEAIGRATLLFRGNGACLTIGSGTSFGIMPMRITGILFKRSGPKAGSIGLRIRVASNGYYDDIACEGFEIGIWAQGCINNVYDFKRGGITGCTTGILMESIKAIGGGLRFDANLTYICNAMFKGGTENAIVIKTGDGVGPIGSGGCIRIDKCTFEGVRDTSIYVENYGEVAGTDELHITDCWFENYGNTVIRQSNSRVKFDHCFIAGGSENMFQLMNNSCSLMLEACCGYFLDKPAPNGIVTLGGSATETVYSRILYERCVWTGDAKLNPSLPGGISVPSSRAYRQGFGGYNYGFSFNIEDEISKFVGPNWKKCDLTITGGDGIVYGSLYVTAIKLKNGAISLIEIKPGSATTITDNNTSEAAILFQNDGTGRWFNMIVYYNIDLS